jgi:hypothetical protein
MKEKYIITSDYQDIKGFIESNFAANHSGQCYFEGLLCLRGMMADDVFNHLKTVNMRLDVDKLRKFVNDLFQKPQSVGGQLLTDLQSVVNCGDVFNFVTLEYSEYGSAEATLKTPVIFNEYGKGFLTKKEHEHEKVKEELEELTAKEERLSRDVNSMQFCVKYQPNEMTTSEHLETAHGIDLPDELAGIVNIHLEKPIDDAETISIFRKKFVNVLGDLQLSRFRVDHHAANGHVVVSGTVNVKNKFYDFCGRANGVVNAFIDGLMGISYIRSFRLVEYYSQPLGKSAVSYIKIEDDKNEVWGVGIDGSVEDANIKALVSAYNLLNKRYESS